MYHKIIQFFAPCLFDYLDHQKKAIQTLLSKMGISFMNRKQFHQFFDLGLSRRYESAFSLTFDVFYLVFYFLFFGDLYPKY